jgi:hypothetical protein
MDKNGGLVQMYTLITMGSIGTKYLIGNLPNWIYSKMEWLFDLYTRLFIYR